MLGIILGFFLGAACLLLGYVIAEAKYWNKHFNQVQRALDYIKLDKREPQIHIGMLDVLAIFMAEELLG